MADAVEWLNIRLKSQDNIDLLFLYNDSLYRHGVFYFYSYLWK